MIKFLKEEKDFEKEIKSDFILVDFYADWCGPCKMLGKVLESMEDLDILKIDCDKFGDLSQQFGVMSIPTIIVFSKGELLKKSIGFMSKEELKEFINEIKKEIQ